MQGWSVDNSEPLSFLYAPRCCGLAQSNARVAPDAPKALRGAQEFCVRPSRESGGSSSQTESRVWRKLKTVSSLGKANKLQAQALGELQSVSAVRYTPAGAVQLKPWHKNTIGFEKRLC